MTFSINMNLDTPILLLLLLIQFSSRKWHVRKLKLLGVFSHLNIIIRVSVASAQIIHVSSFELVTRRSLFTSVTGYRAKPVTDSGKAKCPQHDPVVEAVVVVVLFSLAVEAKKHTVER